MDILSKLRRVAVALALLTALGTAYFIGFYRGESAGYRSASGIIRSSGFVAAFDSLKRLRNADQTNAIHRLESYCYSTAADLLASPGPQQNVVGTFFRDDLIAYRKAHARPFAEQTPTEKRLDSLLSNPK